MRKTVDMATGRWRGILSELGIERAYLVNRHGPCPLCGGEDRFRFDDKDGQGTYFCTSCGPGKGMTLAMQWTGLSFRDCAARVDEICGHVEAEKMTSTKDRVTRARRRLREIGAQLQPLGDLDPVSRYLRRRGIRRVPKDFLRYHPALGYYERGQLGIQKVGTYPAMVAAFRRPDGAIESLHATYLTPDGHKANVASPKKALGVQEGLNGCAIRLSPVHDHIGIAEGIETALSVTELYGIPCWSCYSANGMETFIPPEFVGTVTIFPDSDANFTGQAAAASLAKRLALAGFDVTMASYLAIGRDYNDVLMENHL